MHRYALLVVVLTLALAMTTGATWVSNHNLVGRIERIEQKELRKMISTTWSSGGKSRTLTSRWKEYDGSETYSAFLSRHAEEVSEALAVFPEDS